MKAEARLGSGGTSAACPAGGTVIPNRHDDRRLRHAGRRCHPLPTGRIYKFTRELSHARNRPRCRPVVHRYRPQLVVEPTFRREPVAILSKRTSARCTLRPVSSFLVRTGEARERREPTQARTIWAASDCSMHSGDSFHATLQTRGSVSRTRV